MHLAQELGRLERLYHNSGVVEDDPSLQYVTLHLTSLQPGLLVSTLGMCLHSYTPYLVVMYREDNQEALEELMDEAEECWFRGVDYDMTFGVAAIPAHMQATLHASAASYRLAFPVSRARLFQGLAAEAGLNTSALPFVSAPSCPTNAGNTSDGSRGHQGSLLPRPEPIPLPVL
jgi:hypothetical protein